MRYLRSTGADRSRVAGRRTASLPRRGHRAASGRFERLLLVGATPPVSFFAYPDQESWLTPPIARFSPCLHPHEDGSDALAALAEVIGAPATGLVAPFEPSSPAPHGALTAEGVMRTVAALLPENAIVADEGITSTLPYISCSPRRRPTTIFGHGRLHRRHPAPGHGRGHGRAGTQSRLPGGDGSAMYTLQALWTQARERLDVITVIYANRSYAVLESGTALFRRHRGVSGRDPCSTCMILP